MVAGFETDRGIRWGQLSSAAVSIMLPVIAVALFLQRHIVKGAHHGGRQKGDLLPILDADLIGSRPVQGAPSLPTLSMTVNLCLERCSCR